MKKHRPATDSKGYTDFIADRDRALEALYVRAIQEVNDYLRRALSRSVEIVAYKFSQLPEDVLLTMHGKRAVQQLDADLSLEFSLAARHIGSVIEDMNAQVYILSFVGEAEAIGRALKQPAKYNIARGTAEVLASEDMQGESVEGRVALEFSRIRRDIIDAVELSRVRNDSIQDALERVKAVLPKPRTVKRPKRKLSKVTEADQKSSDEMDWAIGFVSDDEWQRIVNAYTNDYVPKWRGPETVFDISADGLLEEWYGWDVEQYMANEFVSKVRTGQDTVAKQNGIKDMVWISVVDDKTDKCCLWRDGKTSEEIEKELTSGKHRDDEHREIVPPAHFNCRCSMAPMLDVQLAGEEFELPASNEKEFDKWLNS